MPSRSAGMDSVTVPPPETVQVYTPSRPPAGRGALSDAARSVRVNVSGTAGASPLTVGRCTAAVYGDPALEGDKYDAIVFANRYRSRSAPEEPPRPSPKTGNGGVVLYAALALGSMAGIAVLTGRKERF